VSLPVGLIQRRIEEANGAEDADAFAHGAERVLARRQEQFAIVVCSLDERKDGSHSGEDPDAHCLPQGVPKLDFVSYPWKLIETPSSVVILYETFTFWRQIFTDGRTADPNAETPGPKCATT